MGFDLELDQLIRYLLDRNIASVDHSVVKEYYTRNIMEPLSLLLPQVSTL